MKRLSATGSKAGLRRRAFQKLAAAIRLYPNGIAQMNGNLEGLVESSDNIGIISTDGNELKLTSEVRGAYQSTVDDIVKTIDALAALLGAKVRYFNAYVPWEFAADSKLRPLAVSTYRELYGGEMKQLALHAGLECGFFAPVFFFCCIIVESHRKGYGPCGACEP